MPAILQLHWLDWTIVGLYFAAMIAIGVRAMRKVKNIDDYYTGGQSFGRLLMILYAFGAGTHADSAVGVTSQSYRLGMAGIWYQWIQIFNTPLYWLLSPVFRRARCTTTADFYEMRYGPSLGLLYGFMGIVVNIGYLSVALLGSAKLIESLTNGYVGATTATIAMTAAFLLYSIMGGLIAAVWNEVVQGTLTIVMSVLLVPFVWTAVGGVAGARSKIANIDAAFSLTAPGEIGLFWIIAAMINQMFSVVAQPHIMSNNAAGKTELDNRIGFCAGVTLKRVCTICWALTGVLAMAYYGADTMDGDHVFGALVRDLLPRGFAGLMLASIMASVMDNGAVYVITSSALFTRNLMRMAKKTPAFETELLISRIFSVCFAIAGVALTFLHTDVPAAMRFMFNLVPLIGISFWLGLWWRRANRYGAWASFVASSLALIVGTSVFEWTGNKHFPTLITFYLACGLGAGVIISLLSRPESPERLDRFFLTINTPVGQEEKLAQLTGDLA
ncbi:MAG TPA: sodium:solute symporter family protein [Bryobacteraceae bacterium]|nr:sodium:solute symporter family protein [Bryobacteraceae bacterium]